MKMKLISVRRLLAAALTAMLFLCAAAAEMFPEGRSVCVETEAGRDEFIAVDLSSVASGSATVITGVAENVRTPHDMIVDYRSTARLLGGEEVSFTSHYDAVDRLNTYHAEGGLERSATEITPAVTLVIPLTADKADGKNHSHAVTGGGAKTIVTGDPKAAPNDGIYDYTITQVKSGPGVSVTTTGFTVTDNQSHSAHTQMKSINSYTFGTETNGMIVTDKRIQRPTGPADAPSVPEGFDYAYIGSDQFSRYYAAFAYTKPQPDFPDEQPAYSSGGLQTYVARSHDSLKSKNYNLVIPRLYLKDGVIEEPSLARWASVQQYTLADREGNTVTAYCADQLTNTQDGFGYNLYNLTDASYFTAADAAKIRTVVLNGFWGTQQGRGSLEAVRNMMRQSGRFTPEEISALNEGMAITATQYAIWFSSNRNLGTLYLNAYYTNKPGFGYPAQAADKTDTDLIYKLAFYLTDLGVSAAEEMNSSNTVINELNFLDAAALTLTDGPAGDVYTADVSFKLTVMPAANNGDDLVMRISGPNGLIATGRIAGALQPGEVQLTRDPSGFYTFSNLPLSEGVQNIRFMLDGAQNLVNGAYLYLSQEVDGKRSQPMVSLTEGVHQVDVDLELSFQLDIANDKLYTQRIWRTETSNDSLPATGDDTPIAVMLGALLLSMAVMIVLGRRRTMN